MKFIPDYFTFRNYVESLNCNMDNERDHYIDYKVIQNKMLYHISQLFGNIIKSESL